MPDENIQKIAKHRRIYDRIFGYIMDGVYPPGKQIPTEQELAADFNVSRPTVGRALQELEQKGLITRRRGAGTFVKNPTQVKGRKLGILVPGVSLNSGELFSTMVSQMSREVSDQGYVLMLNDSPFGDEKEVVSQTKRICGQLINMQVAGVFFMPLSLSPGNRKANQQIVESFKSAGIAVTLLDRDIHLSPKRSTFDLVCMSNERASYAITEHLIKFGARKIAFAARNIDSSSIIERINGYHNALSNYGLLERTQRIHRLDIFIGEGIEDEKVIPHVEKIVSKNKPDALVCVNDRLAAVIMKALLKMGYSIPEDIRLAGFDDMPFVEYLPVGLTTVRQPVDAMAREAVRTLLDRIGTPDLPARDIVLTGKIIVRESCGCRLKTAQATPPKKIRSLRQAIPTQALKDFHEDKKLAGA